MVIRRGEIYWADLGENVGSEPSFNRPVLVIQANQINRTNFRTVIVIGITSSLAYAEIPGNVFVSRDEGILSKDSVICTAHMVACDKIRFGDKIGEVTDLIMDQVEFGIGLVLDLK